MIRKYKGFWDDGHDSGEFDYFSEHRNRSKENMEDMISEYIKRYGNCKNKEFRFGYLIEELNKGWTQRSDNYE